MPRSAPELDSFLSSIGAHALSTQLSSTTSAQASAIHDRIQEEIDTVNDSTLSLLSDKWDTFNEQLEKGQTVLAQLEEEEEELQALERQLDGPEAFLPSLISHLEAHQSLAAEHTVSNHTVTLLSSLLALHSCIATFSDAITAGQLYPLALNHLQESIQAVERGAEDWIEETEAWKLMVKWQADEQVRFETTLQNTFEAAFDFTFPSSLGTPATHEPPTTTLALTSRLQAAPNGPLITLGEVLQALDEFGHLTGKQSKVEGLLARVSKSVLRGFVAPFLEANGTIEWSSDEEASRGDERKKLVFDYPEAGKEGVHNVALVSTVQLKKEEDESQDPIFELSRFLTFFTAHSSLFDDPTSRYTSLFTASLTPSIQSHVITSHLVPSLPSSTNHLTSYLSLLSRTTSFESTILPSLHLFAFLPSFPSSTSSIEESHILSTWAKSLPQHYARALGERALARVRNQVKNWDWANPDGGEMVEVEVREEEEMEGLLRGLELGLDEGEDDGSPQSQTLSDEKDKKRRTELETVPKGAKREMTLEEALAPRPQRIVTPPPPPAPREPTPPIRLATPPAVKAQATGGVRKNKSKLGAAKITKTGNPLPPRSPSPPPMFQGDDLAIANASTAPSHEDASSLPPISTSTSAAQLDPFANQQHNRSNSTHGSGSGTPILSPRPISIPSAASFTHAAEQSDDEQLHDIVERAQRTIAEEGTDIFEPLEEVADRDVEMVVGETELEENIVKMEEQEEEELASSALTSSALELRDAEEEESKPVIKREEDEDQSLPTGTGVAIEIVEPELVDIKREEEEGEIKEEEYTNELESTPQLGDFEPTPQPLPPPEPEFPAESDYTAPRFYSQENYAPRQFESTLEPEKVGENWQVDENAPSSSFVPAQEESNVPAIVSLPPPTPIAPLEETTTYAAVPPPPRTSSTFAPPPPKAQRVLSPPPPPQRMSQPSPQARSNPVLPPSRQVPTSRSPTLPSPVSFDRSQLVSPPPPAVPSQASRPVPPPPPKSTSPYAAAPPPRGPALARSPAPAPPRSVLSPPPPRQGVLSPPPNIPPVQARASPAYPRQSTVPPPAPLTSPFGAPSSWSRSSVSPRPPSRNQDGPVLNHIQQRFVSPPPSQVNPYSAFPVPTPQTAAAQSSYIPANDPLLADLFGSGGAKPYASTAKGAYFAPDPPGRQQRSNSTSSQGSNYRPSSRGSQHQQYAPQQYYPQPGNSGYYGAPHENEVEEIEDRFSSGYGGYGQGEQREAMRLRGGASYLSDSDEDSDSESEEAEHVVLRLRGGATLDLGEMDDEGNKSGDDWGFGDDGGIEDGGDEDAWGFGDEDNEPAPPSPSPPVLRNPPPVSQPAFAGPQLTSPVTSTFSPPTSPIRTAFASNPRDAQGTPSAPSHAASASISSVSSQTSTLSRPPSYTFSSTLAPPVAVVNELEPAEEEEDLGGGDDAWGFDEDLETESPPAEPEPVIPDDKVEAPLLVPRSEIPRPNTPPPAEPIDEHQETPEPLASHSPPPAKVVHEVVLESADVLPPISIGSGAPPPEIEEVEAFTQTASESSPSKEVDEWGFTSEAPLEDEPTSREQDQVVQPAHDTTPQVHELLSEVPSTSEIQSQPPNVERAEEEPVDIDLMRVPPEPTLDSPEPVPSSPEPPVNYSSDEIKMEEPSIVEQNAETATMPSADGPLIVNDLGPSQNTTLSSIQQQEQFPMETPALDDAEEGHFEDEEESGWGLDESDVHAEEDQAPPAATPALDVAEEGHSVVESDGWDIEPPSIDEPSLDVETSSLTDAHTAGTESTPTRSISSELAQAFEVSPVATPALDDAEFGRAPALDELATSSENVEHVEETNIPETTTVPEKAEEEEAKENENSTQSEEPFGQLEQLPQSASSETTETEQIKEPPAEAHEASTGLASSEPDAADEHPSSAFAGFGDKEEVHESGQGETPVVESALTAPAEDLEQQPFPSDTIPPRPSDDAQIADAPAESVSHDTLRLDSTPTLPQPLPHSDDLEHIAHDSQEALLNEAAATQNDDAALFDLEEGEGGGDDPWGIEGGEGDAVDSGLTSQETFAPDEQASKREEQELPVEDTLLESTSLHEAIETRHLDQSRRSSEESEPLSPPHSDTVLVEPMSSSNSSRGTHGERNFSSPEVIDRSDAWGFDPEESATDEGAEVLGAEEPDAMEADSTVQHELERPVIHEESTVQHVDDRPVVLPSSEREVDLMSTSAQPQELTFSPPVDSLPASDVAPPAWTGITTDNARESPLEANPRVESSDSLVQNASRSTSPSPGPAVTSLPPTTEDEGATDDPWDLDLEDSAQTSEPSQVVDDIGSTEPDQSTQPPSQESTSAPEHLDASAWSSFNGVGRDSGSLIEPDATFVPEEETADEQKPQDAPEAETESPQVTQEEEGWGWDESGEQEASPEPELEPQVGTIESREDESREEDRTVVAPLAEAAGAISAVALGAAAAVGLTTRDRSPSPPPSVEAATIEPSSSVESPEVAVPPQQDSPVPVVHERKTSNASAEGWGWDGDEEEGRSRTDEEPAPEEKELKEPVIQPHLDEQVASATSPVRMEKMMVSRRSREIVQIAEEILAEALTVADPSFEHPQFAAASAPLLSTFVSLLSLYRATAAVHNSTLLASVPAIGMQFANDADWIGREVERVWKAKTGGKELSISPTQVSEVEAAIESTRQLGRDTRQKQVAIQRAALMESLDEASGFLRTSDDSRYATCERALQQVTHTLQRLALVWKPVMTPTALYTTLGGLVNEVLLRVLDEIEDQTDISEEESIRLNRLCKMLHELESLFDGSETSVGREVPIWFKFVFLSELLEASMADILFLFDHGHLVDFSPQEIVRLIRALFSDSPLRNRNVEKILAGHPSVTPGEEEDEWAPSF